MPPLAIAALLAAAGKSSRMGFAKARMLIFGTPAIMFSCAKLQRIYPQKLFISWPKELLVDEELSSWSKSCAITNTVNRFDHLGYFGSIKTVVAECGKFDGLLVMPVDAPIFSQAMLITLVNYAKSFGDKKMIIVPYFYHKAGHPIYLSKHFFNEFNIDHPLGLRSIIARNKKYLHGLSWPDDRLLLNLNSPSQHHLFIDQTQALKG